MKLICNLFLPHHAAPGPVPTRTYYAAVHLKLRNRRVTRHLHIQRRTPKIKKKDKALQRRTKTKTPHF